MNFNLLNLELQKKTNSPHMSSPLLSTFSFSDNSIGFIIDGPYDEAMVEKIQTEISKKLEVYERINFYIEDTKTAKLSSKAILKSLPFKFKTRKRFDKVAIVTDRKWLRFFGNLEKIAFNVELKIFPCEKRLDAIQWISY